MKPKRHTIKPRGILSAQEVKRTKRMLRRTLKLTEKSPARLLACEYLVSEKMPLLMRHVYNMMDLAPDKEDKEDVGI